jgi:hypothetical protein
MAPDSDVAGQIQQIVERWGVRGPWGLPVGATEQERQADGLLPSEADSPLNGQAEAQGWSESLAADIEAALQAQAPEIDEGRDARRLQSEFMNWRQRHGLEPSTEDWQRLRQMGEDALSAGVMWPH